MAHQVALVEPSRGFATPNKAAAVALLLLQVSRQLSNAKVPKLDGAAVSAQQQVACLDISVQNACSMDGGQSASQAQGYFGDLGP